MRRVPRKIKWAIIFSIPVLFFLILHIDTAIRCAGHGWSRTDALQHAGDQLRFFHKGPFKLVDERFFPDSGTWMFGYEAAHCPRQKVRPPDNVDIDIYITVNKCGEPEIAGVSKCIAESKE